MSSDGLPGGNEAGELCRDAGLLVRGGRHLPRCLTVPRALQTASSMA